METDLILTVQAGFGFAARKVNIYKDHEYIITPLNPRKLKNRGRHVIMLEKVLYTPGQENADYVARIKYTDNNRLGRVDFGDLEPVNEDDYVQI